jgi:hypothetical protein
MSSANVSPCRVGAGLRVGVLAPFLPLVSELVGFVGLVILVVVVLFFSMAFF